VEHNPKEVWKRETDVIPSILGKIQLTWFYRRTGRVYLGALMVSSLAMWFLAAGTVIGL